MRGLAVALVMGVLAGDAQALTGLFVEAATGTSFHAPTQITLRQSGFPTTQYDASWSTRPFTGHAPYYRVRAGWGPVYLEFLHNKLYLEDPVAPIQAFEISHGYSLLGPGARIGLGPLKAFLGVGGAITDAHTTVRGRRHEDGYALAGVGAHAAAAYWFESGPVAITFELGATAAWARVGIANGTADVPDYAVHLTAGIALAP